MINYYKILGLENYATVDEVKIAYKAKVKVHHPDINKSDDAEEMTQYLNMAKDHLDTIENKERYDQQLKMAYFIEIQRLQKKPAKSYWETLSRRERKDKLEESRKLKIKEKYLASIQKFPLTLRIVGLSVLIIWGLQLVYSHYFIRYGSLDYVYAMLGYLLLSVSIAAAANEAYTHYLVKSLDEPIRFNYEKAIGRAFILSFIVAIISVNGLNSIRKNYHLSNHFEYGTAHINMLATYTDKVVIEYRVDGRLYIRGLPGDWNTVMRLNTGEAVIKYAKVDPNICELVLKGDKFEGFDN